MRKVKWLVAAGLLVSATGCVETNGYPTTSAVIRAATGSSGYGQPAFRGGYGLFQLPRLLPAADLLPAARPTTSRRRRS